MRMDGCEWMIAFCVRYTSENLGWHQIEQDNAMLHVHIASSFLRCFLLPVSRHANRAQQCFCCRVSDHVTLSHILLRVRRNGQNTTSGIKSDQFIRSGMPEDLYVQEILAKTQFCGYFSRMSKFCPILWIGDVLRMRVKPEVVVRFLCPTNSSSQFWS